MVAELWALTRVWFGAGPLTCKREMLPGTCQGSTPFWVLGKGDPGSSLYCRRTWAMRGDRLFAVVGRLGVPGRTQPGQAPSPRGPSFLSVK